MNEEAKKEGQETTEAPKEGQASASPSQTPTQETLTADKFLAETGFKSYDEAAKSLKEGHAKITTQGQQISQLEGALQAQAAVPAPVQQGQAGDFFDDPEGNTARIARNEAAGIVRNLQVQQSINEVRNENPKEFEELRPIMQQIFAEKPSLNALGVAGLRQAKTEARERKNSYIRQLGEEIEAMKSGAAPQTGSQATEAEIRRRVIADMATAQNATVPETAVGRAITSDDELKRNKLVKDGNVDELLDMKFKNVQP